VRRLTVLVATLLLTFAAPAWAVETDAGQDKGTVVFHDERSGDVTRTPPAEEESVQPVKAGGAPAPAPARSRTRWFRFDLVQWDATTGTFCVDPRWTQNQAYAERQGRIGFTEQRFDTGNTGLARRNCPDPTAAAKPKPTTTTRPAGPQAPPTPDEQVAADAWQHVENLPRPTLSLQPDGYAITGKKAYLQIHGPQTWTRTIDNPIGDDVVITATSEYVIDWGDPTDEASHHHTTTSQGGPYPDGDVTHVYVERSERTTITVTQRWSATWQAGARTGTLQQLSTTADPPLTIEVRDLQAVRQR
jgi:hypothetical protein